VGYLVDEGGFVLLDEDGQPLLDHLSALIPVPEAEVGPLNLVSEFSLIVGPWNGDPMGVMEVPDFDAINIRLNLHDGTTVSFGLAGTSEAAQYIDGLVTDVWVLRQSSTWLRTRVLPIAQEWGSDGEDRITVESVDYKRLLSERHLHAALDFTGVDQGDIIWGLIAHAQAQVNGGMGITKGAVTTGVLRDRTEYEIGDNIGGLIEDLTKVINGPCWAIGPGSTGERELTVTMPEAFPMHAQPIVRGGNVRRLRRQPGRFANSAYADGSTNSQTPTVGEWFDHPSMATDPRGRWEVALSPSSSVTQQETIGELARGTVERMFTPAADWQFDLSPVRWLTDSTYLPGHRAKVRVPSTLADTILEPSDNDVDEVTVQIVDVVLNADNSGAATVQVAAVELPS
jgi:hypothetical protein